jgi:hypothetical protein
MDYTVLVYKQDKRYANNERLHMEIDLSDADNDIGEYMNNVMAEYPEPKYRAELIETYREVVNMMTGEKVMERYDTPRSCSVNSESYWSN